MDRFKWKYSKDENLAKSKQKNISLNPCLWKGSSVKVNVFGFDGVGDIIFKNGVGKAADHLQTTDRWTVSCENG